MRPPKVILLVDGNEHALSLRRFLLKAHGYRVLSATTAHQALDLMTDASQPLIDIVVSSVMLLPQMTGPAFLDFARRMQVQVRTLLLAENPTELGDAGGYEVLIATDAQGIEKLLLRLKELSASKRGPRVQMERAA